MFINILKFTITNLINMLKIGVAIPCYHGHIQRLGLLLETIKNQTRLPDYVVVSCSGVKETPYVEDAYNFPLKLICTEKKLNTSQNRNIAASYLSTDIISFIDADDMMYKQRLEIIEKGFMERKCFAIVHNFTDGYNNQNTLFEDLNMSIFHYKVLDIEPWGYALKIKDDKRSELINIVTSKGLKLNIHNGHISILNTLFQYTKFREEPYYHGKEDSVFTADILRLFPDNFCYCHLPLSMYVSSSTNSYCTT